MSFLSHVADALERELEVNVSDALSKLVVSRQRSIAAVRSDVSALRKEFERFESSSASALAIAAVLKVKEARLKKLELELEGFVKAVEDPRQALIPGTESKKK